MNLKYEAILKIAGIVTLLIAPGGIPLLAYLAYKKKKKK